MAIKIQKIVAIKYFTVFPVKSGFGLKSLSELRVARILLGLVACDVLTENPDDSASRLVISRHARVLKRMGAYQCHSG